MRIASTQLIIIQPSEEKKLRERERERWVRGQGAQSQVYTGCWMWLCNAGLLWYTIRTWLALTLPASLLCLSSLALGMQFGLCKMAQDSDECHARVSINYVLLMILLPPTG